MSVLDSLTGQKRQQPRNATFIAVMADAASTALVEQFATEAMVPHAYIREGTVDDLIDTLVGMERPPRQLVVDVSTSAMPLSDLARLADVCPPGVSVLAVGQRNDISLFREMLRMGVDDYLFKPLTMDLLRRALTRQSGQSEPVHNIRTGKIVACLGVRGGVGTSMVAANLGWHLSADLKRRIALLDLDPFGGPLDLLLGCESNRGLPELLKNINRLDPQYVERSFLRVNSHLFLLASGQDLAESGAIPIAEMVNLLSELKKLFHYIIVDCPGHGGDQVNQLINSAGAVVLVSESSVFATRETARVIKLVETRDVKVPLMLVVNQSRQPGRDELRLADFEEAVGRKASHVLPFDRDNAIRAENLGPPVVTGQGPLALALRQVAGDLAGLRVEKTRARQSLLDRIPRLATLFRMGG